MFSNFSRNDWLSIWTALVAAGLLVVFAKPIATALRGPDSFPHVLAFLLMVGVLSGLAEFFARERLSRPAKVIVAQVAGITALVLGVLYLFARQPLAASLGLTTHATDSAAAFVFVIVVARTSHLLATARAEGRGSEASE